jgi:acyl-CoA synthetase (AMP-forming)/AMP-acid ligase II
VYDITETVGTIETDPAAASRLATAAGPTTAAGLTAPTIAGLLAARASATPHALMVMDENGRNCSFRKMLEGAERAAAGLLDLGVRPGDVVSWQLPNGIEMIILSLALARLGVVQNPLVMMLRERELTFICRQARSAWLITGGTFRGTDHHAMAQAVAASVPGTRVMLADGELPAGDPAALPAPPADGTAVSWIFYTSGTTSDPKGARHTDAALMAASAVFTANLAVAPEDVAAALLPLPHVGGILHIVTALRAGSSMVTSATFDPATTPDLLAANGVTLLGSGLPFLKAYLARQDERSAPLFPTARVALLGGSPRPASLHDQVKGALGIPTVSGYGMTECPYATWGRWDDSDEDHATSEGCPAAGGEVIVVREDGSRAADGEPGELRVRAPQLMVGYVDPALDEGAFDADGYFRTGDLGVRDARGYITVTGRIKDVIIRKMENISAREVEDLLITHEAVADVALIGLPDPETGERACAVVVPARPDTPPDLASLCGHLLAHGLSNRKLPEQLQIVAALPRNAMGKVVKRELTAQFTPKETA